MVSPPRHVSNSHLQEKILPVTHPPSAAESASWRRQRSPADNKRMGGGTRCDWLLYINSKCHNNAKYMMDFTRNVLKILYAAQSSISSVLHCNTSCSWHMVWWHVPLSEYWTQWLAQPNLLSPPVHWKFSRSQRPPVMCKVDRVNNVSMTHTSGMQKWRDFCRILPLCQ